MKLLPLLSSVSENLARQRMLAGLLFGIRFEPLPENDHYFDVTTVVLFRRVAARIDRTAQVLDLGTGAAAVLGISLWKRLGCQVTSVDIDPEIAALARANIARNGASIPVVCSRYFDSVSQPFDTVVFNPPYVPTGTGARRELSQSRRVQWDGGSTGTAVIEDYLDELRHLDRIVTTYMGVNHMHVPRLDMTAVIERNRGCTLQEAYRHRVLPVDVYTIVNDR